MQAVYQVEGCGCINAWKIYYIRFHVSYSVPDDERKMFETCRRKEELNYNINLKSAFCWLTLRNVGNIRAPPWPTPPIALAMHSRKFLIRIVTTTTATLNEALFDFARSVQVSFGAVT